MRRVTVRQNDPFAETVVLPQDEVAAARQRKRDRRLSLPQIQRLLAAAEQRKKPDTGEQTEN